jgi:hypothetical protein
MNPSIFLLPLTNLPQLFNITLGATTYIMNVVWNDAMIIGDTVSAGWFIGFANQVTGEQIVNNIPLICGVDLLDGLEYLGFGGQLIVYTNGQPAAVPTLDNLGTECNVYFITPPVSTIIS